MPAVSRRRYEQAGDRSEKSEQTESRILHIHHPESGLAPSSHAWVFLKALRPNQWSKNLLVFMPMLFAHQLGNGDKWLALTLAFVAFNACASAVYLFNDILDVDADRRHPIKRYRPLAAGQLSLRQALLMAGLLLAGAFGFSLGLLSWGFAGILAIYVGLTTAYTLHIKRMLFLDVIVLAGLYTLRLLAGGMVAEIPLSPWLRVFSMFLFVSLALVKRYVELRTACDGGQSPGAHRGYLAEDAETLRITGVVSGIVAVVVFCLYLSSESAQQLYPHNEILWLVALLLFYWIVRVWLLAQRSPKWEDPVLAATTDVNSCAVGFLCLLLAIAASL